jgi:hypothetical protein
METPASRGPLSAQVRSLITGVGDAALTVEVEPVADPLTDDDLNLALWMAYELHYRGFDDMAGEPEWDLDLLRLRAQLEGQFASALRERVSAPQVREAANVPQVLVELTADSGGPSLSRFLQKQATREQFEEFVIHRSAYHLKEADPHSWAIPRLTGQAKAAMVEIQFDEYGAGRADRMHSALFRGAMRGLGLDDSYGAYINRVPGVTLAQTNLISFLGLHHRWRGALAGHLGAFEMTSTTPNRRYAAGYRRVGGAEEGAVFYDEHVEADAVHEQIASHDLCGRLALAEPSVAQDIVFGAAACLQMDDLFADYVRSRWEEGRSSLLPAMEAAEDARDQGTDERPTSGSSAGGSATASTGSSATVKTTPMRFGVLASASASAR